ncbi:MAG TPA: endonuclease/exonuclease/phosphatase family protein [Vicinamibacterales bacterium]|jgi:exodeoxyribonuclease-3
MTLRILSYNIRRGGAGREQPLAAVIRSVNPDIVVFEEATRPDVVERLAVETGMNQWSARAGKSLAFMSRHPVTTFAARQPAISRHAFLEIVPSTTSWRVFGVHLSAVHAAWTERRRLFELRALLRSVAASGKGPHVLIGDFNTVAPGDIFDPRKLPHRLRALVWLSGGHIRWRTIATVLAAGYIDSFRQLHPDEVGYTLPTPDPHVRLDYAFVPGAFAQQVRSCEIVRTPDVAQASDHFPLLLEIGDP